MAEIPNLFKFLWFFFKPCLIKMLFFGTPAKISQECLIQSAWNFQAFLSTLSTIQLVGKIWVVLILSKDNVRIHSWKRFFSVIVIPLVTAKIFDLLCKMCSTHCMLLHFNCIKPKNHFSIWYSSWEILAGHVNKM